MWLSWSKEVRRELSGLNLLDPDLELLFSKTVRKHNSIVSASQSVLFSVAAQADKYTKLWRYKTYSVSYKNSESMQAH